MTKRKRAQLVELLRCAADGQKPLGICKAADQLNWAPHGMTWTRAMVASRDTDTGSWRDEDYRAELLEAAVRVEQGEWL